MAQAEELEVWIGTSSAKPSKGIYYCGLNSETGKLSESRLAAEINGPGFLALHPKLSVLYAVGSLDSKNCVAAYQISQGASATLSLINSVEIGGGSAAHVSVDPTAQTLLTAQYGGGTVGVFSLEPSGAIAARTQLLTHTGGSGVVANRQAEPHPHWSGYSPDNQFAFVPDLGLDEVVIYKLDAANAQLQPHGAGKLPPGAGPRHMKFHPNGKWIYVLNELDLSISLFDWDAQAGTMSIRSTVPTVPKSELAKEQFSSASEIRVHPSGKFVYSANRGHDTISVFSVDMKTGELTVVEIENVRGATPRNFNLDPSGRWLLVAGQDSNTLASFAVDSKTGGLTYNRSVIQTPAPICVLFGRP